MFYVVEAKSLTSAMPIVKTTNWTLAEKAQEYIKKLMPESVITIMTSSVNRENVPFAEEYSLE